MVLNILTKQSHKLKAECGKHFYVLANATKHIFLKFRFVFCTENFKSQDSVIGIATGRPRGLSWSPGRVKYFSFSTSSRPVLGPTQPPIQWIPGVKRQEREAEHSPPASAEVKKMWFYTSTSPYAFVA
jgi:hypothetical protein